VKLIHSTSAAFTGCLFFINSGIDKSVVLGIYSINVSVIIALLFKDDHE